MVHFHTPKNEEENLAGGGIITIISVSLFFVIISIFAMWDATGNFYASGYFTISSLFDAVGFHPILNTVPLFSPNFYPLFTILVLDGLAKIIVIGFLIATIIEFVSSIDVKSKFAVIEAKHLKKHVIICGYSKFTENLEKSLDKAKQSFLIIENDRAKADMLKDLGYKVIEGDFKNEDVLNSASIKKAKSIIFDSHDDFENLLGVITAKTVNEKIKVIVKANKEESVTKILRGGADLCIIPEIISGIEIGNYIVNM